MAMGCQQSGLPLSVVQLKGKHRALNKYFLVLTYSKENNFNLFDKAIGSEKKSEVNKRRAYVYYGV